MTPVYISPDPLPYLSKRIGGLFYQFNQPKCPHSVGGRFVTMGVVLLPFKESTETCAKN